jgi:predicted nucleic acid-binding protein
MYLLDTVVLSELRKRRCDANLVFWIGSVAEADLYISVATVVEIELGIERQRKLNAAFAEELARWLDVTLRAYSARILPLTVPIARRWGQLAAQIGNRELDLAIAATALEHGLAVVTRDVSDFVRAGVATLNPFEQRTPRTP